MIATRDGEPDRETRLADHDGRRSSRRARRRQPVAAASARTRDPAPARVTTTTSDQIRPARLETAHPGVPGTPCADASERSTCDRDRRHGLEGDSAFRDEVHELRSANDLLGHRVRPIQRALAPPDATCRAPGQSSSDDDAATSILSRTLPSTCTTSVTVSSTTSAGSYDGPRRRVNGRRLAEDSTRHSSSAAYGANGASICGQRPRGRERSPAGVQRGPHLVRQDLQLGDGGVEPEPLEVLGDALDRPVREPTQRLGLFDVAPRDRLSDHREHAAEPRVHARAGGPARRAISFQSMSSSNGPANSMIRRIESAPHRSHDRHRLDDVALGLATWRRRRRSPGPGSSAAGTAPMNPTMPMS